MKPTCFRLGGREGLTGSGLVSSHAELSGTEPPALIDSTAVLGCSGAGPEESSFPGRFGMPIGIWKNTVVVCYTGYIRSSSM